MRVFVSACEGVCVRACVRACVREREGCDSGTNLFLAIVVVVVVVVVIVISIVLSIVLIGLILAAATLILSIELFFDGSSASLLLLLINACVHGLALFRFLLLCLDWLVHCHLLQARACVSLFFFFFFFFFFVEQVCMRVCESACVSLKVK